MTGVTLHVCDAPGQAEEIECTGKAKTHGPLNIDTMKKILVLLVTFSVFAGPAFSQNKTYDSCIVGVSGLTTDEYGRLSTTAIKEIGRFEVTEAGEEDRITKVFRLPNTRLFVIASLVYTDESMAMESGSYSVTLDLTLSRKRRRDIRRSLSYAGAEFPANPFEVGRVRIITRLKGKAQVIVMECKKMKRP